MLALAARAVFAPSALRAHGTRSGSHEGWRKDIQRELLTPPPAICPTVPVLATLLPWAESPVWLTAAHVKSRIHLPPAAFARFSHSCARHSRPGGHKNVFPAGVRPKVRIPERVSSLLLDDDGSHPQPKGQVPPSRPFALGTLSAHVKPPRSWW